MQQQQSPADYGAFLMGYTRFKPTWSIEWFRLGNAADLQRGLKRSACLGVQGSYSVFAFLAAYQRQDLLKPSSILTLDDILAQGTLS